MCGRQAEGTLGYRTGRDRTGGMCICRQDAVGVKTHWPPTVGAVEARAGENQAPAQVRTRRETCRPWRGLSLFNRQG